MQSGSQFTTVATSSISQMLQAEKQNDQDLLSHVQADLAALPKPSPGDSAEATRLNKLGLVDLRAKNYSEAASFFSQAAQADPSDPKLLSNLGYAETFAGVLPSAEKHLLSSIALDPSRSVAWGDLGLVYAKQGKQDDAVASFLIGYKVSNGDSLGFLKSLGADDDPSVRNAGSLAISKIQPQEQPSSSMPLGRGENRISPLSSTSQSNDTQSAANNHAHDVPLEQQTWYQLSKNRQLVRDGDNHELEELSRLAKQRHQQAQQDHP
jgi:tetratricopeptide (TPR) repeat protein